LHRGLDERNARFSVFTGRKGHTRVDTASLPCGANRRRDFAVNIRKALDITFRMPGRNARQACGCLAGAGAAAGQPARRFAERREAQLIGIFLPPDDAALVAEYPQLQPVLAAGCDLACPDAALATPPEAQHQLRVVVEL